MLFKQLIADDLGCASYLVGDEHAGTAVVVDPSYAIEPYLDECERHGVRLVAVLETHTHADHVSGHGRLALQHGVPVRIHPAAEAQYPHEPFDDGTEIELGSIVVRVVHTPGHRPEHCALAVVDRTRGDEPWLVLTGDSLFVGDAARPDLAVEAREGAEAMFHSLQRLVELGDGVEVFPGHVAGSLCGAAMSSKASTTIGYERRFNHRLVANHDEFVADSTGPQPPKPPNMERIVEINRGPFLGAQPPLARIDDAPDAVLLDVRPPHAFADGHRPGAANVPVAGSSFATKAAFVLPERPVLIEASDEDEAVSAARALHAVGLFDLAGWRPGSGDERVEPVTLDELERMLATNEIELVDVREPDERDEASIPGSTHLPYRVARQAAENGLCNGERPLVTICESGARAAIAASVLTAAGVAARPVLDGGIEEWTARGGEVTSFRRCGS
ncbi:MAG TPA: rhodanese-like domain-containing protein [Gaiellaceae bacterium]|nr:rhodanese-like domain-containing protein [Gaiellaceae bacterium]